MASRLLLPALTLLLAACGGGIASVETSDAANDASANDGSTPPAKDGGTITSDGGAGVYSAVAEPGGLDHLFIQKKDTVRNFCFKVHLVHPSAAMSPSFSIPQPWGPAQAFMMPDANACDGPSPVSAAYAAKDVTGKVTFGQVVSDSTPYPKTVSIEATLFFAGGPPSLGSQEIMSAIDVPVTGI